MKKLLLAITCALFTLYISAQNYPIDPVPFTKVHIEAESFWGQRLKACRDVTVPLAFSKCESEGRYRNFDIAARQLRGEDTGDVEVKGFSFDDTDVYKTIEGASYLLQTYPDKRLSAYIDSVLTVVSKAQEPDGYLYTARTMNPAHPHDWAGTKRWEKVEELSHEFYNLGHMVDAACAHYQATGKRNFLDIAIRYADCVCRNIGMGEGQLRLVPGHQIAEMALARLYTLTGERKYLEQAKFFLEQRGKTSRRDAYSQAHLPVLEQDEAVGHAVRAAYMYAGMADVAALTGDTSYITAIDRIWQNIVGKKMYITGGIGSTAHGEAFGKNYELPNETAYCETCAAIGNVYVNHRLFLLHGESKYYDVVERTLYNGVISGMSLDGGRFFYPNPLASSGQHDRKEWFGCACCPSNLCRFIPSVPGYFYQTHERDVYVNLFAPNQADLTVNGKAVTLKQETQYPLDGNIRLVIEKNKAGQFALRIRIPGWVQGQPVPSDLYAFADGKQAGYTVTLNGETVEGALQEGYFVIDRKWQKGDKVDVYLDMQPRLVKAHEKVEADRGRLAVTYGPLVYCVESPDTENGGINPKSLLLNRQPQFTVIPTLFKAPGVADCPINELTTEAQTLHYDAQGRLQVRDVQLRLIPYYTWNHRGRSHMAVWLPWQLSAVGNTAKATQATNIFLAP